MSRVGDELAELVWREWYPLADRLLVPGHLVVPAHLDPGGAA